MFKMIYSFVVFVVPMSGNTEEFQWLDLNAGQHRTGIFSIRFSPCGTTLIGGCNNSCIYMCDRETRSVDIVQDTMPVS